MDDEPAWIGRLPGLRYETIDATQRALWDKLLRPPRGRGVVSGEGLLQGPYNAMVTAPAVGERLADLAQRELVARTRMLDAHVHGKTWTLLRMTRMPAVRVEVGYLSSPADRSRLVDPTFRDTVAEGLLVAVQRLYLPKADDPPTGALRLPAVAS